MGNKRINNVIEVPQFSSAQTAASGTAIIYPKSDGLWYYRTASGAETLVGNGMPLRPSAGSASAGSAPVKLTSGPVNTTPEAGALEYDGIVPFFAPTASKRGLLKTQYTSAISADFTLQASATAQSVFPTGGRTLSVDGNTLYEFDGLYILNTGATSHTTAMGFSLATATVSSFEYATWNWSAALNTIATTSNSLHVSGVASKVLNAASISVYTLIYFVGTMRTGTAGTITPQITFSVNPTGTNLLKAGSYISFRPLGANTFTAVGPWA